MNLLRKLSVLLAVVVLTTFGTAQSAAKLKRELKKREAQIEKTDPDAYVELARWARDNGLLRDVKRLLGKAVKIDPDHEAAQTELGFVKVEGEWVTRAKAEVIRQKAHEAAMKEKGFVEVDGVWVEPDHVADAKKGVFWHDGEQVSKFDKNALISGQVRHPRTGFFVKEADVEKADSGMFPLADDRWGSEEEANRYHANRDHPWVIRSAYTTLVSTMPIAELEKFTQQIDAAIDFVKPLFFGNQPPPSTRPVIWIAKTNDEYLDFGNATGGGGSAYGAFLSEALLDIPGIGPCRPVFFNNLKDWGEYYCKHAGALAFAYAHCAAHEIEVPRWFLRGVGGLAERFQLPGHASHFGKQHIAKGGVKSLKSWFSAFDINGDMASTTIDFNVFQAGLVLEYAMRGGDEKVTAAMQDVSKAIVENTGKSSKAFEQLERALAAAESGIRARLQELTR